MTFVDLKLKCQTCRKLFFKKVSPYKRSDFSNQGTKSILFQYWCPHCKGAGAARYEYVNSKSDGEVPRVKRYVDPKELFIQRPSNINTSVEKNSYDD